MEEMLWIFPHIGEQIFNSLSNKNIAKCKEVSKTWNHFIAEDVTYVSQNSKMPKAAQELELKSKKNHIKNIVLSIKLLILLSK